MRTWRWQQFRLDLPADWEMLRFAKDPARGSCGFADRYQYRVEFNWRAVEGPPDFTRMIGDYIAKLQADEVLEDAERLQRGQWTGFVGGISGGVSSRFGRYFPESNSLAEIVFIWPDGHDRRLEQDVLQSVTHESLTEPHLRRWTAFGMDLLTDADLQLTACRVECASVRLRFSPPSAALPTEAFERHGLVAQWLHDGVAAWLRGCWPQGLIEPTQQLHHAAGHRIQHAAGTVIPSHFQRLGGRPRQRWRQSAWICPRDERLYSVSELVPVQHDEGSGPLAGRRLSCCPELVLGR